MIPVFIVATIAGIILYLEDASFSEAQEWAKTRRDQLDQFEEELTMVSSDKD